MLGSAPAQAATLLRIGAGRTPVIIGDYSCRRIVAQELMIGFCNRLATALSLHTPVVRKISQILAYTHLRLCWQGIRLLLVSTAHRLPASSTTATWHLRNCTDSDSLAVPDSTLTRSDSRREFSQI